MEKYQLMNEIVVYIQRFNPKNYSVWTIGITNNPENRKTQHEGEKKNTEYWKCWEANSEADAREIEQFFLNKGMNGGTGGGNPDDKPTYVYVF